jgi:MYXO-CTERM domain-containing protein
MRRCVICWLLVCGLVATGGSALALDVVLPPSADTFINSAFPDNNNGGSPSVYTGENGRGGAMRVLLRFAGPAGWQGRVTITRVVLTMTTRGTGVGEATPPWPATESLQAVSVAWAEGSGFGDASMENTVGQACGTAGATWNQPNCAGGAPWSGGSVSTVVSGVATVSATSETPVTWDSAVAGNAGLLADVQAWIDSPAANRGWRLLSSTDSAAGAQAQRFYARETPAKGPTLSVTATCRAGFVEADGGCVAVDGQGSSGCSCTLAGRHPAARGLAAVGVLAALAVRRRRPRATGA